MEFPSFDHAAFLDRVWQDAPPAHNIGSSSFHGGHWKARGLPDWPEDIDPGLVNLKATADLRAAIAAHVGRAEAEVMATVGTTGANLITTLWAHRPGGNVVVERPIYSPLEATAEGIGATVRRVDRDPNDHWRIDPHAVDAACDTDTTLIVLASPNNPTQATASTDDLRHLGEIAEAHDCHVLVDQVYRELTDHPAAAGIHDRLIQTAGFNKSWGLPTIRVGWLVAHPDIIAELQNVHMQALMSPSAHLEAMAARLLPLADRCREQLHAVLRRNVPLFRDWVEDTPGVEDASTPGLTAFPKLPVADTAAFCERVARDPGVAMVPGEYFGVSGHARIGLGGDTEQLATGLGVLAGCLRSL